MQIIWKRKNIKYNPIKSKHNMYLIYDTITLKVYKRRFHPKCINLLKLVKIGRWNI